MWIDITDLELFGYHGVNAEEKEQGQTFYVCARLCVEQSLAGLSDNLNDTVNYSAVCKAIAEEFSRTKHNLIERLAFCIADRLLGDFQTVQSVHVTVKKPNAPLKHRFGCVSVEESRSRHTAYLGLGSNLGDKIKNLDLMVEKLNTISKVTRVSDFMLSKAQGEGTAGQPDYLNAAVCIQTILTPTELLTATQAIEKALGRTQKGNNAPRTADIDILLYDDITLNTPNLTIPHPQISSRPFVQIPLTEIKS